MMHILTDNISRINTSRAPVPTNYSMKVTRVVHRMWRLDFAVLVCMYSCMESSTRILLVQYMHHHGADAWCSMHCGMFRHSAFGHAVKVSGSQCPETAEAMSEDDQHEPLLHHGQDPRIRAERIAERTALVRMLRLDVELEHSTWAAAREMRGRVLDAARETVQARRETAQARREADELKTTMEDQDEELQEVRRQIARLAVDPENAAGADSSPSESAPAAISESTPSTPSSSSEDEEGDQPRVAPRLENSRN